MVVAVVAGLLQALPLPLPLALAWALVLALVQLQERDQQQLLLAQDLSPRDRSLAPPPKR